MELSWMMKLRIAAVAAVGVALVGIVAWPGDSPPDPFGSIVVKSIGTGGAVSLLVMAFLAGLIAYFASWPYGREIGILAVPFGLSVWAVRAGSTGALMQMNPTTQQRLEILTQLKWEPFFWLAVVAAGFIGVLLGQRIRTSYKFQHSKEKTKANQIQYFFPVIALVVSVFIAQICLRMFSRDVILSDSRFISVMAQPPVGQVVFAVLMSFGIAAFAVKKLFDLTYIWTIAASSLVTAITIRFYINRTVIEQMVEQWPANFFTDAVLTVLPVQMVAFGTIGAIIGYWMAVRYGYWRKHEMK